MTEFPVHADYKKVAGTFWELPEAQGTTTRSLTVCTPGEQRKLHISPAAPFACTTPASAEASTFTLLLILPMPCHQERETFSWLWPHFVIGSDSVFHISIWLFAHVRCGASRKAVPKHAQRNDTTQRPDITLNQIQSHAATPFLKSK